MRSKLLLFVLGALLVGAVAVRVGWLAGQPAPPPPRQPAQGRPAGPVWDPAEAASKRAELEARIPAELRDALSPDGREALLQAMESHVFAWGLVGFAAEEAPQLAQMKVLSKEKNAQEAFTFLFEQEDRPTGQLLGLCGLYYTNRRDFDEGVAVLGASSQRVLLQSGCRVTPSKVEEIVDASITGLPRPDIASGEIPRLLMGE